MEPSDDDKLALAAARMLLKALDKNRVILSALPYNDQEERKTFGYTGQKSNIPSLIGSFARLYRETKEETDVTKLRKELGIHIHTLRVAHLLGTTNFFDMLGIIDDLRYGKLENAEDDPAFARMVDVLVKQVSREYLMDKYQRYIAKNMKVAGDQPVGGAFSDGPRIGQGKVLRKKPPVKETNEKAFRKLPAPEENIGSSSGLVKRAGKAYYNHLPVVKLVHHIDKRNAEKAAATQPTAQPDSE